MNQLDFVTNPEVLSTSRAAYESIKELRSTLYKKVLKHIRDTGGATCDETEQALGLSHQTCSARFNDLSRTGRIYISGLRRPTRSGRQANVYETN